ncbi:hypothetical protein IFR04_002430 [Cadophora malorum]|uniref:Uncharacterized protein n=1 Tax=Cadophora malorum TaxID=108018 RepID=A0A8H8BUP3_9HELO|nr:hypothetical protein IFR04_002430 [Cadophora malorum]
MTTPIYLVSADSVSQRARAVTAKVIKALEKEYDLVHVANCENTGIMTVKDVLKSLIVSPRLLVVSGTCFDEETEEIREIAYRTVPGCRLISIPNDLKELDREGGDKELVEYLQEQIENSGIPVRR